MTPQVYMKHPELKRFIKHISANEYLFHQGQIAHSMFLILEGRIHLIGEKNDERHVASLIEPGEFLGEKALIAKKPYQRSYSAQASMDSIYLELTAQDLEDLQANAPSVMPDLLKGILSCVAERFDKANFLIRSLRTSNQVERVVHCLLYFSRCSGRKLPGGTEVLLTVDSFHFYIDLEPPLIESVLLDLQAQRLLIHQLGDQYLIPNDQALLNYLPKLTKRKAA